MALVHAPGGGVRARQYALLPLEDLAHLLGRPLAGTGQSCPRGALAEGLLPFPRRVVTRF
ncbi:MAG: hypothetical protein HY686_03105 [Chloroflexi bacterium]|nr:hypothetical protein [Chloroflexota bacterium]